MTIKQQGGVFGRNPTFNDVTVDGTLTSSNLDVSDQITTVGSSKAAAVFDRTTTVGDIIDLKYNGASIGSIGTNYGFVLIGNEDTYLSFRDSQADIVPAKASGNSKNGSVSLGASSSKFNNIYLAGNVIVDSGKGIDFSATSGTGTSELFDDYEEGTWAPAPYNAASATFSGVGGIYTKIGNVVYASFTLLVSTNSDTNSFIISGLPYTVGASDVYRGGVAQGWQDSGNVYIANTRNSTDRMEVYANNGTNYQFQDWSGKNFRGLLIYSV